MSKHQWGGMPQEDIPGYLIDEVSSFLKSRDITSVDRHYESYQSDSYRDQLEELVDSVVEAVLEYNRNDQAE